MQKPQGSLKLRNLGLQLLSNGGIEIMSVYMAPIFNAVAESGVIQFNIELSHQQQDVVIYRRNTSSDGNVEGNGASVILRHTSRNGISTHLGLGLKQADVKSVWVVMQPQEAPSPEMPPPTMAMRGRQVLLLSVAMTSQI